MEGLKKEDKDDLKLTIEFDENLTNAEKIQALQKKAKKLQYKINEIRTKLNDTNIKFEELSPRYEILEKDYHNLLDIIENDQNKLNNLKDEYKEKIKEFEHISGEDLDIKNVQTIRLTSKIKEEIENVNIELSDILDSNNQIEPENPEELSFITNKLLEFQELLKKETFVVKYDQNDILEIFEKFRRFEALVNEFEELLNKFLAKINIESQLQITISDDNEFFFIQLNFVRNNEKHLTFEQLTTPEKVFFVMIFHISIKILSKYNNIIISNVFLPSQYNKLSIYRTIRKILPLFEIEKKLLSINLVFIISNLEMKKKIENLRVIDLKERR